MYVYGKNVAKELISNKRKITRAYLSKNMIGSEIENELKNFNTKITYLEKYEMDKLESGNHQGVILQIPDFKYLSINDMIDNMPENPFIVILDHLEDPHNFGAIIRTCEASGVDYILIPKNRSVRVNSTVMKTSVGALDNVKIVEVTNINNTIKLLKKHGIWIIGTDMENSVPYNKIDYTVPIALIIGSEGFGISNLVSKNCDFIASIPMYGKINSLNASVAAGIMIYEVVRQLYMVCEDNEDAVSTIFKKYEPVIDYYARKYVKLVDGKGLDYNDLYQEGLIGLDSAIKTYKDQKNIKFSTFAFVCIKRKIMSAIRKANRKKHSILNESYSIDYKLDDNNSFDNLISNNERSIEDLLVGKEQAVFFNKKIEECLTKFEKQVYELKVYGFSSEEISKTLNKTMKSIESVLFRIRVKLRKILKEIN